jgi:serine/threonine protein kinase
MICPLCHAENLPDSRFCHKCATPLYIEKDAPLPTLTLEKSVDKLSRGSVFAGRYEIIEELGKGGMGRVYKVFDQKIKEIVALKLIHPEISVNEKAIERFRNELKFARKVSHRNVCRTHDLGEEGYTHFITMEYVDGENLKGFIRRAGQLTPGKAVSVAKQICEGLAEAHRQGLVHRDLKPQNIMIDREGNARIMDFGIARFVEAEGLTGSGVMIGTPEYMAPEQAESSEIDKRADIYSLGIIIYEMVTGKVPFEGKTPLTIIVKHKSEQAHDPRELNPHLSKEMTQLIFKCLEKDREKRYQSAEDLLKDLALVEQGLPTAERAIAKKAPAAKKEITVTFRFGKLVLPVLAVVVLAVIALFIWNPFSKKQGPAPAAQQIPQLPKRFIPTSPKIKKSPPEVFKEAAPLQLKVTVDNASIQATPEIGGKVLTRVPLNTILKAEPKRGEWYRVTLEKGGVIGYIHELQVKEVSEEELAQPGAAGPAGERPARERKEESPKTEAKKQIFEEPKSERNVSPWLKPEVLKYLPEALKFLNQKDPKDIKDAEKFMENLKGVLPQDSAFSEHLNRALEKMKEWRKLQEEGKVEEAGKTQREGQAEMESLLSLVSEREEAQKAQALLDAAKSQAQKSKVDEKNLLYRLASRREQDAVDAFNKDDFSGAKILSVVLERTFRLSIQCQGDAGCIKELAAYIKQLKSEVEKTYSVSLDRWLYEKAVDYENKANLSLANKEFENAAESFIQAAFLYESIKAKSASKK